MSERSDRLHGVRPQALEPTEAAAAAAAAAGATAAPDTTRLPEDTISFGTFKPVGHVVIGILGDAAARALEDALDLAGFRSGLVWVTARESAEELEALIRNASPLAGFGYEITLMRRYLELSRGGHRWLLVPVADDDAARRVGEIAYGGGATMAVRYGRLVVEDLQPR
jgi:hypothetical protein